MNNLKEIHKLRAIKHVINQFSNSTNDPLLIDVDPYNITYPIKFDNEYGKWEIREDGQAFVQPYTVVEFIEMKITVSKEGIEFNDDNKE